MNQKLKNRVFIWDLYKEIDRGIGPHLNLRLDDSRLELGPIPENTKDYERGWALPTRRKIDIGYSCLRQKTAKETFSGNGPQIVTRMRKNLEEELVGIVPPGYEQQISIEEEGVGEKETREYINFLVGRFKEKMGDS